MVWSQVICCQSCVLREHCLLVISPRSFLGKNYFSKFSQPDFKLDWLYFWYYQLILEPVLSNKNSQYNRQDKVMTSEDFSSHVVFNFSTIYIKRHMDSLSRHFYCILFS